MQDFCASGVFNDTDISLCLPVGSETNFPSGLALMEALTVYPNCTGVVSAECSEARRVIYGGIGCTFCADVADKVAPAHAQCAVHTREDVCVSAAVTGLPENSPLDSSASAQTLCPRPSQVGSPIPRNCT